MPHVYSETLCQLRYDTLLIYNQPHYDNRGSTQFKQNKLLNFKEKETYSGKITVHTKKRISKAINIMLQSLEKQTIYNPITRRKEVFKINFITLTVSAKERALTANEGYKILLRPFLQWLTKTMGVKTYIWKAELTKRKQLHYHITTSTWMHWKHIRNKWNSILSKNNMLDNYIKEHGHANANSTDVHKVYKIRNISGYLHKELCKTLQNNIATNGKLWDCSQNLKGQNYYTIQFDTTHEKILAKIASRTYINEFTGDQFTVLKGPKELSKMMLTKDEREAYAKWIMQIRKTNTIKF